MNAAASIISPVPQLEDQPLPGQLAAIEAPERRQEKPKQHGSAKMALAFLTLIAVFSLFAYLPTLAPASIALGFVAFWICGGIATITVLARSGRTPGSS